MSDIEEFAGYITFGRRATRIEMLQKASGKPTPQERVDAEFAAYVTQGECHAGRVSYFTNGRCRPNLMLRTAIVFAALSGQDPNAWGAMTTGGKWHVCRLRG
jgi:hypothetical protein